MAAKVFLLLALLAAVAYATNDCNCEGPTDEEATQVWEFFKTMSAQQEDPNNEYLNAVLPGELSPLIDCDCDKTERRRKRKILPEVSEEDVDYSDESIGGIRKTPKCPHGYAWFGILCVDEKLVMDRK